MSKTLSHFMWTAGTIGASSGLKFGQNILLSRLLVPEIMGIMVIVNSVRLVIDLLTDIGIEQNIVHDEQGQEEGFRNTAWTLQVIRGVLLTTIFVCASPWLAKGYEIDSRIFLLVACAPIISALHSTAIFLFVKQLEVRRRSLFELLVEILGALLTIGLAIMWRSIWAPVVGVVATAMIRSLLSYTLPQSRQSFAIDWVAAKRIVHFGKWVAVSSLVMCIATNVDRLYLGGKVSLALLGIYGIARAIAELPVTLARRISYQVIFPTLAQAAGADGKHMANVRLIFVLAACSGAALLAGCADVAIQLVYDSRYYAAGWMLSILMLGGVFSILSNLNEAVLLAAGKPALASYANFVRLLTLLIGLIIGLRNWGMAGAVIAVALVEMCHYGFIALGQVRVRQLYWRSDLAAMALAGCVFAAIMTLRAQMGWGSPFADMNWGVS